MAKFDGIVEKRLLTVTEKENEITLVFEDNRFLFVSLKDGKVQENPDFPGGVAALRRYVSNIDVMRQLTSTYLRPIGENLPNP